MESGGWQPLWALERWVVTALPCFRVGAVPGGQRLQVTVSERTEGEGPVTSSRPSVLVAGVVGVSGSESSSEEGRERVGMSG
jgi:hypothetical protein